MRAQLGSPERLALYVKTYNAERPRLAASSAERDRLERRASETKRALDRALDDLVHGRITEVEADAMFPRLCAAHATAATELAAAVERPKLVSLHSTAVDRYLSDLRTLADTISRDQAEGHHEASFALRRIVESVTVMPAPAMPAPAGIAPEVFVEGHLASLIGVQAFPRTDFYS